MSENDILLRSALTMILFMFLFGISYAYTENKMLKGAFFLSIGATLSIVVAGIWTI